MKKWLNENGLKVESLGKKEVKKLIEKAPPHLQNILELRLQLSKSSIKKYQAMENTVCSDNRARGMFQFYGANRTGRFCLTGDHQVLTRTGWQRFDEWDSSAIACWNAASEAISFQEVEKVEFDYSGFMYTYFDSRIDQCSTPDHKMRVKKTYSDNWEDMTVEEMSKTSPCIPMHGYRYHRGCANPNWIRVLIMTQADGHYSNDGAVRFRFKKIRKVERCKSLLRKADISFSTNYYEHTKVYRIDIPSRAVPLWLRQFRDKTFGFWLLDENPDIFFDELPYWDGYKPAPNSIQYTTTNKQNADIVQALAHMSGRTAILKIKRFDRAKHPNWSISYVLSIWLSPGNNHRIIAKPQKGIFVGKVYCAVTKTGYFLVRRGGKVWVTGNSGRNIQLQNLVRNKLEDLNEARELVKDNNTDALKLLYEDIPDTLSQLIRTAFIAGRNKRFIVADYSAIEARVIAWFANEKWRLDVFKNGGDIYCASAAKMFKVPVEKHGINGHLRQKGKQAELACGYGGSVGALKAMGAVELGIKEEELKPIVTAWRVANPEIVKFWWAVDKAAKRAVKEKTSVSTYGIKFFYQSGILFILLPSKRTLSYVKPKIGVNQFGGECITYEGIDSTKSWSRINTYGPKIVENIVQATSRDLLCYAMKNLSKYKICMHIHDEVVIEAPKEITVKEIIEKMTITPSWAKGLLLNADAYETEFYKKD
ncbi:MAG: DNA polymerase [Sphaerochaetaceae bacterium]|nr:DNA polymerase [Sphaerochaetaceae bacterium]